MLTVEGLKKLTSTAEGLQNSILALETADPSEPGNRMSFRDWNTGNERWPEQLLKDVLIVGRYKLLENLKQDLANVMRRIHDATYNEENVLEAEQRGDSYLQQSTAPARDVP